MILPVVYFQGYMNDFCYSSIQSYTVFMQMATIQWTFEKV